MKGLLCQVLNVTTRISKNLSYFVCSSTKNMRTVWLHSILFLQVKSVESSLDDSTKKVVVFGRLLSSKHSLLCPLCLFSQFYTKIDFLENFATEPFKC